MQSWMRFLPSELRIWTCLWRLKKSGMQFNH